MTPENLKTNFQSNLSSYKQEYAKQTAKDMERAVIGFKGPDGVIRELTVDELQNSKEIGLSGEQKEFILTSWQQGSFESGWLSGHSNPGATAKGLSSANTSDRTQIFIDLSENEVKVHNRIASKLSSMEMEGGMIDYIGGTLTVDITNMKGDSFTPGCATVEPKIEIQLTNLSDVAFDLPEKLKVEKKSNAEVFEKIKELGIETNLSAVTNNSSKTKIAQIVLKEVLGPEKALQRIQEHKQDKVFEQIKAANLPAPARGETIQVELNKDPSLAENSPNPKSHQRAVDLYCKAEKNPVLREQFAMKRLDGFLKAHDNTDLNKEKVAKLKEGVVGILTPLCQDKTKEVPIIEKNAEKLIRECAAKVNKTTSLSQAWQKFKDKATNVIANLRGKGNKVKDLLSQYPGIKNVLQENLKNPVTSSRKINNQRTGMSR